MTGKDKPADRCDSGDTGSDDAATPGASDQRAEFDRLSRNTPRDRNAERAFIEARIELVRSDPRLSPADKRRLIAELRRQISVMI